MPQIPRGVKTYQELLQDSAKLLERLYNGRRMLKEAHARNSVVKAFDLITLYEELSSQLLCKLEEIALIQQFLLLGRTMFIRQDGRAVSAVELISGEDQPLPAYELLVLKTIKDLFGDIPEGFLMLEEPTSDNGKT